MGKKMFSKINFDPIFNVLEEHMVVGTNIGLRNYYIKSFCLGKEFLVSSTKGRIQKRKEKNSGIFQ